jgi:hypothetical protein
MPENEKSGNEKDDDETLHDPAASPRSHFS